MGLRLSKLPEQTWREGAIAQGRKHGMERDVTETFDELVKNGTSEQSAAWEACYEWDVLDYVED